MLRAEYLVVGTGAAGMGFVDTLIGNSDSRVVMVDRRHAPGGHWHDAYPFVRLHMPSAFYGVDSTPLGDGRIQQGGLDDGLSERAGGPEVCAYYDRLMQQRLIPSGRVRHFPLCEYLGDRRIRSLVTGAVEEIDPSCKVVDATYLEAAIPAKVPPPFEVGEGAQCVPVNGLAVLREPAASYVASAPARPRWMPVSGYWGTGRQRMQFAGSDLGTAGCSTGPTTSPEPPGFRSSRT